VCSDAYDGTQLVQNDNLQLTAITISAAFITAVNVTVVHHKVHSACVISRDSRSICSKISNARLKTKMLVFLLHKTKNNKSIIDKTIIQNNNNNNDRLTAFDPGQPG